MVAFHIEKNENKACIYFDGDIDIELTDTIDEIILDLKKSQKVEINFSTVQFVDSTGIGLLIQLVNELKENNIRTEMTNINPDIREIFSLLQIQEILGADVIKV